jgi:hypothetical protein
MVSARCLVPFSVRFGSVRFGSVRFVCAVCAVCAVRCMQFGVWFGGAVCCMVRVLCEIVECVVCVFRVCGVQC